MPKTSSLLDALPLRYLSAVWDRVSVMEADDDNSD